MIPRLTHRLFLTLGLEPGPVAEPPISNLEFLNGYLDLGVWLRVVNAHAQLEIIRSVKSSQIQRLAALAGFYQQVGLAAEDALSNLIAWSVWASDDKLNLADILRRTSLRFAIKKKPDVEGYCSAIRAQFLNTSKRVDLNPEVYLESISQTPDAGLPAQFGIPWKRNPSVRLVPRVLWKQWDMLPHALRSTIGALIGRNSGLLTSCYNKLKHGPQLILADPIRIAKARGHLKGIEDLPGPTLRLLLDGSRTQETQEEFESGHRVSPFLVEDVDNAVRQFFQSIVHTANLLFVSGTWLFNVRFPESRRQLGVSDPFIGSIISEQALHLAVTFPDMAGTT